jgi:spore germination cell wall hydrolase CwlJ-like protein
VIPGAIFYHAAYQAPTSWFRTRQRIGALGDHIFYR